MRKIKYTAATVLALAAAGMAASMDSVLWI